MGKFSSNKESYACPFLRRNGHALPVWSTVLALCLVLLFSALFGAPVRKTYAFSESQLSRPHPTPTASPSPSPSPSPSATPSPSPSPEPTPTPEPTATPNPSPTPTPTQQPSPTPIATVVPTPTKAAGPISTRPAFTATPAPPPTAVPSATAPSATATPKRNQQPKTTPAPTVVPPTPLPVATPTQANTALRATQAPSIVSFLPAALLGLCVVVACLFGILRLRAQRLARSDSSIQLASGDSDPWRRAIAASVQSNLSWQQAPAVLEEEPVTPTTVEPVSPAFSDTPPSPFEVAADSVWPPVPTLPATYDAGESDHAFPSSRFRPIKLYTMSESTPGVESQVPNGFDNALLDAATESTSSELPTAALLDDPFLQETLRTYTLKGQLARQQQAE